MKARVIQVALGVSVVAGMGLAGIVPAAAPVSAHSHRGHSRVVTATTQLRDRPDSGGDNSNWANDRFTRVATITPAGTGTPADCGITTGVCNAYTATLKDSGTFTTIAGALPP